MKGLDLFSESGDHILRISKDSLKGAINRLKWGLDTDQVRMNFQVSEDSDDLLNASLSLSVESNKGKVSTETIKIHRDKGSSTADFSLNYKYLLQGIDKFQNNDIILYLNLKGSQYAKLLEKDDKDTVRILFLSLMKRS
jgi:DNA polymerase III sliding clamp (beta) subunit (PCNA family)